VDATAALYETPGDGSERNDVHRRAQDGWRDDRSTQEDSVSLSVPRGYTASTNVGTDREFDP
jgi:hypothetical protein